MSQGAGELVAKYGMSFTAGGGILGVIGQNSSALTVIVVAITGAATIWINHRNAKANERRNEINERDIKLNMIKKFEAEGKFDEAQLVRESLVK